MSFSGQSALVFAFLLVVSARQSLAVCAPGQMAVGSEMLVLQMLIGPARAIDEYSGCLMAKNRNLISHNGITQATGQMCKGGYAKGASVMCDGSSNCRYAGSELDVLSDERR
ncbi:uncharacterized protein PHACADRAFT_202323 [Phanerochaete carnosa HHB-10118-sp]|uniref:Cyanovirin-N domain-containing protein n=1 Tax=Phanerochaete carnosa (strain HHB-10118-sp) TaxID=650164 RepID=K5VQ53_PHACS|nr:uncharacterized protein PHACADRAFT_202323 [Phanerochaete carnosa HHB-10118-sp]EKM48850.1 hypothetical protein PHACADRAFT_202323 [Phanerochaete carnosa HHB-10118-sp]